MFVKHIDDVTIENVIAGTGASRQVLISGKEAPHFALRRFEIQPGGNMPLHTNTVEHEQYVLHGRAEVMIGDKTFVVNPDNAVYIPAGVEHSYRVLGGEPFIFICVVPNEEDIIEVVGQ